MIIMMIVDIIITIINIITIITIIITYRAKATSSQGVVASQCLVLLDGGRGPDHGCHDDDDDKNMMTMIINEYDDNDNGHLDNSPALPLQGKIGDERRVRRQKVGRGGRCVRWGWWLLL